MKVIKRDGRIVEADPSKVVNALRKAFESVSEPYTEELLESIASKVFENVEQIPVEAVQDKVIHELYRRFYIEVANSYSQYRKERSRVRESKSRLMKVFEDITFSSAKESDLKRENANIDGDTPMGAMLRYGSEGAKAFNLSLLRKAHEKAFVEGDIHIHDFDFYTLTTTCTQIDLVELFKGGFSTGHGFLREPNSIESYSALACIALQANQNDQHGGQSIANFDYAMAIGVKKSYIRKYKDNLYKVLQALKACPVSVIDEVWLQLENKPELNEVRYEAFFEEMHEAFKSRDVNIASGTYNLIRSLSLTDIERSCYQSMEALIHNLNTMHSRAGAQVPFSSINYGLDTSDEGRMIVKNLLLATESGLGHGETPIFPIQIFRVKEGVNYNPTDANYDLFKLSMKVSAKRLFPNYSFIDAPFNLQYYKEGDYASEVCYMGCRTRVMANVYDKSYEKVVGRGNLSFTSINLVRLGIESKGNLASFYNKLEEKMLLVAEQLLDRFAIQSNKRVRNYPFLMGQGVWHGSENLKPDDSIKEILKHGTLSIGFIGLAETLTALVGSHHAENEESQKLGLEIIAFMRGICDDLAEKSQMNFTLLATPAEGLSGRFLKLDREKYGVIEGVTDKEYYTNSFHVPVGYKISAANKIRIEAPYHALTNAGHISYVELDGDLTNNIEAFEKIVRYMKECGIGYGSINHPVDRDPVCGYNGIIHDECPQCHRLEGDIDFERIRRITGYLVGTVDRWNNAKKAEEHDRVKHG